MKSVLSSANRKGPVVLVASPVKYSFPFSYAYLAGYLESKNEEVVLLFRDLPPSELSRKIMALKPLLVGFGNLYTEMREIKAIIEALDKDGRDFPVVVGGQMVSPTPEFAVKLLGADAGVIGEGEIVLHKLVQAFRDGTEIDGIGGLAIRREDVVKLTGPGEIIENLADLPPVPYHLFPKEWLTMGEWFVAFAPRMLWRFNDRVIPVHGGRGCPLKCNFCYHHSPFRMRPIELMVDEAAFVMERFNGNMLNFSDDLVTSSPARVKSLVESLKKIKRPFEFYLTAHFEVLARLEDDVLRDLKRLGCRMMGQGFESGSDRILKLMNKKCTADMIFTQVERLAKFGIYSTGNFMIGEISETREDAEATIRLMKECVRVAPNSEITFSIVTPFPGSALYEEIFKRGLVKDDFEFYQRYLASQGIWDTWKMVVNLSAMSDEEVFSLYNRMSSEYLAEKQRRMGKAMRAICFSEIAAGQMHYRYFKGRMPWPLARPYEMAYRGAQGLLDSVKWKIRRGL